MNLNIVKHSKIWFAISGALIVVSIVCIAFFGLNFGIDFTGGSFVELKFENAVTVSQVNEKLAEIGITGARVQTSDDNGILIRTSTLDTAAHENLLAKLRESIGSAEELRFNSVGPVIGEELRTKAIWAVGVALALILIYIAWAFRHVSYPVTSWKYGALTVLTAFHDVIIPIGVFAVLGRLFDYQIDSSFVAAILTILGYSINDTIVVFDRTRENLSKHGSDDFVTTVNKSLNQTIARSINTTLTTLLALVAVFLFGGESTRQFALALIIGITMGAYSSIFIASPFLVLWQTRK